MARFLVFTLAGPVMAFGDVAPGERRGSASRPSRSALLGLIAAALGLRREDLRQARLAAMLAFAVRIDSAGHRLVDFHTTLTAPTRRGRRFATRREEVGAPDRSIVLSQRSYYVDAAFTIVALGLTQDHFSLEDLAAALARPRLSIHAGRRACPLGLPPAAEVIEARSLPAALDTYDVLQARNAARGRLRGAFDIPASAPATLAIDVAFAERDLMGAARVNRREERRDVPVDRTRWQFAPRTELVAELGDQAAVDQAAPGATP
jgi:CRISPR system Cascade subunit CasD